MYFPYDYCRLTILECVKLFDRYVKDDILYSISFIKESFMSKSFDVNAASSSVLTIGCVCIFVISRIKHTHAHTHKHTHTHAHIHTQGKHLSLQESLFVIAADVYEYCLCS